jgi:hypothetical protein
MIKQLKISLQGNILQQQEKLPRMQGGFCTTEFCVPINSPRDVERLKATKREPAAWGHNWTTLSMENTNTETWSSRLGIGRKADALVLQKK